MKSTAKSRNRRLWRLYVAMSFLLVAITFSPIVLSPGRIHPKFLSLPYTLWTGMLITILLVILTYLASRVRNKD